MKLITRLLLILACFTAAFTAGTLAQASPSAPWVGAQAQAVMHAAAQMRPATLTADVTQAGIPDTAVNAAACSDVEWFRHVDLTPALHANRALWEAAYRDSRHSAAEAWPALGDAIGRYLFTDRGYRRVIAYCQQVTYGL